MKTLEGRRLIWHQILELLTLALSQAFKALFEQVHFDENVINTSNNSLKSYIL